MTDIIDLDARRPKIEADAKQKAADAPKPEQVVAGEAHKGMVEQIAKARQTLDGESVVAQIVVQVYEDQQGRGAKAINWMSMESEYLLATIGAIHQVAHDLSAKYQTVRPTLDDPKTPA